MSHLDAPDRTATPAHAGAPPARPVLPADLGRVLRARAASLPERAARVAAGAAAAAPWLDESEALTVLRAWNQSVAPGDPEPFERCLAWDGLDRASALRLIAAPPDGAPGARGDWTDWVARVLAETAGVLADFRAGTLAEAAGDAWTDEPPFVELWVPLLRAGARALAERVPVEARREFDTPAFGPLRQQLVREASLWGEMACFAAFGAFRDARETGDAEAPGVYADFIVAMLDGEWRALFERLPVLARQLATVVSGWVEATAELLERIAHDRADLGRVLGAGVDPGVVVSVRPALSDPHHGRRRVIGLRFHSGLDVVYKPRPMALDRAFQQLLAWLRERGLDPAPPTLAVLDRAGYGWVECARHAPLADRDAVGRYYRQGGSLLCITHVLRGRDLHQDNVVATPAGPVLVDLEMLFQPVSRAAESRGPEPDHRTASSIAGEAAVTTGLLSMFEVGADGRMFDVGGLRGEGAGSMTLPRRVWKALRSAALRVEQEHVFAAPAANTVRVGGDLVTADAYAEDVLAGFAETYRLLMRHRDALVGARGPLDGFRGSRTRIVPRPTNQYAMLSAVLAGPRYQGDGARRSAALAILVRPFNRATSRPAVWPLVVEERRALEALDVPYFWAGVDDTRVVADGTPVVDGYFSLSGLDAARSRVAALSEDDLAAQRGLLARVLADSPRSTFAAAPPQPVEPASEAGAGATGFLPFALWIADELKRRALEVPGGGLGWSRLPGHAPETSLGAHVLYDGTAGIALFFAALAAVTRDPAWDEVAGAAVSPVLRAIARERWDADRIGAGDGLGSLAYALMWIGRLANRADARAAAAALGRDLEGRVRADRHFDVLSGAAGAIVTCLALDADRRDPALVNTAMACADHLRANLVRIGDGAAWPGAGRQLFAGFAHGAAGIGCALWRLSQRTGDAGAADLARQAFHFERSLYLPGSGNWPISAAADNEQTGASASMTAWCHGAPGIALAHVLSPGAADDPDATARLQAALTTTARWAPGWADHLCCGTLGRVEVLWTAGRRLGVPAATAAAVTLATQVTGRARTTGHFRLSTPGFEYRVFDPGFFRGLSGIGYQLLRLAAPSVVPDVLGFEGPEAGTAGAPGHRE